jgi:hypothetical protein
MQKINPRQSFAFAIGWWWLLWLAGQTYLLYTLDWPLSIALTDSLITQATLAMGGLVMNTTFRFYQPGGRNAIIIFVWSLLMAAITWGLQRAILPQAIDDEGYLSLLQQSWLLRYLFNWLMMAFISVVSWMWFYLRNQQEYDTRRQQAEQLARDAELTNLRQQLQPHFLFNSLNSISALIGSQPAQARTMVQQLSDFLRGTLKKEDQQLIALKEELTHLELYLEIEKVRFGHRLQTQIAFADEVHDMKIPVLLLQPIVENAIKFGLYDTTGETTISIKAFTSKNELMVEVSNPFDPQTSQARQGTGFGLTAIQRRLYLLFFRNDLLHTSHHENVFTTRLIIPQQHD